MCTLVAQQAQQLSVSFFEEKKPNAKLQSVTCYAQLMKGLNELKKLLTLDLN